MHATEILRWVMTLGCGLLGWWIIILNFTIVYRWLVRREHHSWVPFLGGLLACVGMAVCPMTQVQKAAWLPLGVDCGFIVVNLTLGFGSLVLRRLWLGKKDDFQGR